ncbi:MAG: two-component regulator propeller domain-containing protein [Flavobacteriales bacterium]|nr:two-component regulator propeller domain-containing protein [Flavobacteriales bacterium]
MKSLFTTLSVLLIIGFSQAQTFTNYTDADGLANNGVNCLDVATGDIMWFGTQAGVSVFDGTTWTAHNTSTDTGFVNDVVTAIKVLSNGDVWIGSDFGAAHYDGSTWTTYTESEGLGDDRIKTIFEAANGNIWFGTNDGMTVYDGVNWASYGTGDGLPFGGVTSFEQNSSGVVYVGTALGGVTISNSGVLTEITEDEGLLNDKVRSVVIDDQGYSWIGTSDGISVFDNTDQWSAQHTTMFTLPAPDTLNPVEDIVIDSQGNIWAGVYVDYLVTEGGISAYNGTDWVQFEESDGLIGPVVRQLAVDSQDNIWVATSTGISKISDVDLGGSGNSIFNPELSQLNVYPNPASDQLTVELPTNNEIGRIEFFDTSLRLVKTKNINQSSGTIQISVSDLKTGLYVTRIGNSVSRLIVN